jgi:hypothetical protein
MKKSNKILINILNVWSIMCYYALEPKSLLDIQGQPRKALVIFFHILVTFTFLCPNVSELHSKPCDKELLTPKNFVLF